MNYEALGRYTEAIEKLQPVKTEMAQTARTLCQTADTLGHTLDDMWHHPGNRPHAHLAGIRTAADRLEQLLAEASRLIHTANQNAEACGKPKLLPLAN